MPITINGTGSITGLSAGGLPDLSVQSADLADAAVTAPKLDGAQSGSAPIYAARAWVNFNGTGVVAIRGSGNVTSITDNGVGDYTINFTTAMPDANYSASGLQARAASNTRGTCLEIAPGSTPAVGSVTVRTITVDTSPQTVDLAYVTAIVIR